MRDPLAVYIGFEEYVGRKRAHLHNYILVALFFGTLLYFTYIEPNMAAREVSFSAVLAIISAQALCLLVIRSDPETRGETVGLKLFFAGVVAFSLFRVVVFPLSIYQERVAQLSVLFTSITNVAYLALFILLGLVLIQTINRRLQNLAANVAEDLEEAQRIATLGRWELDIESGELYWSSEIYRLFELDGDNFDCTCDAFLSFVHPDDRDLLDQAYRESIDNKKPYHFEHRMLMPDGRIKWVSEMGYTAFDSNGKPLKSLGTVQDITDRKEAELLLQSRLKLMDYSAKHSLEEVLRQTLDEVCAVVRSPIGFYHFVSPDQTELTLKAWSTDTVKHFCHMGDLSGKSYSISKAGIWADSVITGQTAVHNDYMNHPKRKGLPDGHAEVIRELVVPIIRGGRVFSILGVGNKEQDYCDRDVQIVTYYADVAWEIAERKIAEVELEKARDAAEAASREKSIFLANMSHEIRTPLNAIIGMNTLLDEAALEGELGEYASIAREASDHLLTIIGDVLDLSRIEAKQLEIAPSSFNLLEEVNKTIAILKRQAAEKGLNLTLYHNQNLPGLVELDLPRLKQVLINLVGNAIKFTEAGSVELRIELAREELQGADIQSALRGAPGDASAVVERQGGLEAEPFGERDMVRFSVSDTGPGIPEESRDLIFESFSQLKEGKYLGSSGTGLGLAISKSIVELMGGKIWVESEEGRGSTFYFTLPVSLSAGFSEKEQQESSQPSKAAGGPLKLLLVEDKAVNRKLATVLLNQLGHRVDSAVNGREAVEAVEKSRYDAVLMDISMPEMDGLEATRIIRTREMEGGGQRVPIIAMTAYAILEEQKSFIEAGMDGYIPKPIKKEAISEALRRAWLV